MKWLVALIVTIALASCGATVTVDYDKEIDFSQYKTYNYYQDIESGLNNLDDNRIMFAIDSLLLQKGFVKSETPQLLINFFSKEFLSNSRNTIGIGIGGGGNVGFGVSGGIPIGGKVINQTLTIDFIDSDKDALIWQALVNGELNEKANPQQKEDYYFGIIRKALKTFPPSKK